MQFQFLQDICYWNFYEILFTWKSDLIWQSAEHIFSFVIDNCNFHLYKQGLFAENKEKLITGALGALVLREGDQATLPAEEVEAQFHALRRLVASKAGFASLTSLPRWEIQNLFIVHLIMIYGFRKCFIILGNFLFCPILLHRSTFRITLRPQFTYIWWISEVPENIYLWMEFWQHWRGAIASWAACVKLDDVLDQKYSTVLLFFYFLFFFL